MCVFACVCSYVCVCVCVRAFVVILYGAGGAALDGGAGSSAVVRLRGLNE